MKPTDEFFENMTASEQAWLFTMVGKDRQDKYEETLSFVEYLASFTNPEAVKQLRADRKAARPLNDEEFSEMVGRTFGRGAAFQPRVSE